MTLTTVRTQARRFARITSGSAADATVDLHINHGKDEFATRIGGFALEAYIDIAAKFDVTDNHSFLLTITGGTDAGSYTITFSADATDATGATIASSLQTLIQAAGASNTTVTWSDFAFTIDSQDGTDVTVASNDTDTTIDAVDILFGGAQSSGAATLVGGFPKDCTVEADLPTGVETIDHVEWDFQPMYRQEWGFFMSPEISGQPRWYAVRDDNIRIYPAPTGQKLFHIMYRGIPSDITAAISFFGTNYHIALAYFAAARLLYENHEPTLAARYDRMFDAKVKEYQRKRNRDNSRISTWPFGGQYHRVPKVTLTS